ncbi:MAG TPA: circadian clock KaiB family protein [Armatimonadota bacterium]|jgi:circadian clock protein KaiB
MGSLRAEKEAQEARVREQLSLEAERTRRELMEANAQAQARIDDLKREMALREEAMARVRRNSCGVNRSRLPVKAQSASHAARMPTVVGRDNMAMSNACLHLYIDGHAPNSTRAQANLALISQSLPPAQLEVEVIDVLQEPLRALQDNVFVTPLLRKLAPLPEAHIIGDLSNFTRVRLALGLGEDVS